MLKILEWLTGFYWPLLPQTIAEMLWHTEWRAAHRQGGLRGVMAEGARSLVGLNAWQFYVPLASPWQGAPVRRLLARQGIMIWGWGYAWGWFYFHTRASEANWALELMLGAGVPVTTDPTGW